MDASEALAVCGTGRRPAMGNTDRLAETAVGMRENANTPAAGGTRRVRRANRHAVAREGETRASGSRRGGRVPVPTLTCG